VSSDLDEKINNEEVFSEAQPNMKQVSTKHVL